MVGPLALEAARTLCIRGCKPAPNAAEGVVWSSDPELLLPSRSRLTEEQVQSFLRALQCRVCVLVAKDGLFFGGKSTAPSLEQRVGHIPRSKLFTHAASDDAAPDGVVCFLSGGHHVHMTKPQEVADSVAKFVSSTN